MSSKRHGGRIVSDLTRAILFVIKSSPSVPLEDVVQLLQNRFDPKIIRKRAYHLKYQGSLTSNRYKKLQITTKGLTALEKLDLSKIKEPKTWDEYWRVVIYDIPEVHRLARNQIRDLLKKLGFRQVQISVWAHPLPCLDEFRAIQKAYGIEKHLLLMNVEHQKGFEPLRRDFAKVYSILSK